MKLSEMKEILASGEIHLTKSLGQNFLHDANQLGRIVAAAELKPEDKVLEIGPGLGPLTELLIAQAGKVLAIETDRRLYEFLVRRLGPAKNLVLLHADALEYLRREQRDWSGWKLVSNLPYSVASPILVELAQNPKGPQQMVATLQLEVARRLNAKPGSRDYGVLSLLVQVNYESVAQFKIPPSCFFPEPDVDSACIALKRRAVPLLDTQQVSAFRNIVKRSFSQRRKMALKLLKQDWPPDKLTSAFERLTFSPQARAESLSLLQFVELTKLLAS
jgi:16S rRNA (adenine1518-N6/adenine1519-N6)-dimethyltransferase